MLVVLRLSIGWHFFQEGATKQRGPEAFSSAGFLRQAKGPLAERFHRVADDCHQWPRWLAQPRAETRPPADSTSADLPDLPYAAWAKQIQQDWRGQLTRTIAAGPLDGEQQARAAEVFGLHLEQLQGFLEENAADIASYRHELFRLAEWKSEPTTGQLPYHDQRIAQKRAELQARPAPWIAAVKEMDRQYEADLWALLQAGQKQAAESVFYPTTILDTVNKVVPYWDLAVGACLIVGLFTRLAALAGSLLLAGVIATQPPWVPDAQPVYYQWIEMIGLLTLATTAVGRWGGLDFFVHSLWKRCCGTKENVT